MDFEKEVLKASDQQPIIVDFWAPWCGPCQVLGPVLEELEKSQEKWKLVKVNVDENPEISKSYGIRGIPDVRLFHKGKEVSGFTGALPQYQIEKWLNENLPDERQEMLQTILANEDKEKNLSIFVKQYPDFQPGLLALAKMIFWKDPMNAQSLISDIKINDKLFPEADAIRQMSKLLLFKKQGEQPIESKLLEASEAFKNGYKENGIALLIEAVMMNKAYQNELPRKAAIAFFTLEGQQADLTRKYRKKFDMALY